jgi:hypothetical protein
MALKTASDQEKEASAESVFRHRLPGRHTTNTGVVRYPDKRQRDWNGMAMTRIVTKVNNNRTGTIQNWSFVLTLAERNYYTMLEEEYKKNAGDTSITTEFRKRLESFYKAFDTVTSFLADTFGSVPGAGWLVSAAAGLYKFVRQIFPL